MIWRTHELVVFLLALVLFIAAIEVGYRMGRRCEHRGEDATDHNGILIGGAMGLLALLLGFTFAMSVARFDKRQDLVVDEAIAIDEVYKHGRLLPLQERDQLPELLRRYSAARLDFFNAGIDERRLQQAWASAEATEESLWALADSAAARDPHALPTALFIKSLSTMVAGREARLAAFDNHVPELAVLLLLLITITSLGFVGYGNGLAGRRRLLSGALFSLMIAMVLMIILDMDRPRRGITRVNQAPMMRVNEMLQRATP